MKKILAAFALTLPLVAQAPDGLPVMRHVTLAPGSSIDLDSGVVLPNGILGRLRADVAFGRDGLGFFLQPVDEGMAARRADRFPQGEWSGKRLRVPRRSKDAFWTFLRTDHGVARLSIAIVDPYSTASAAVSWTVVPPKDPTFLSAPTDLRLQWHDGKLLVGWEGATPQFLVEVVTGDQRRKQVCTVNGCAFEGLDEDSVHRVRVRGMDGGAISVPAEAVQHGQAKPSVYEVTEYPDRWFDQEGGLALTELGDQADKAEVVFYLYGVFVPGGGVQKLGRGREVFVSTKELPTSGYLPSYGRLDAGDVHAVRLADGRRALLWLQATRDGDLRSGMKVHSVFLPDGRGQLLTPPEPQAKCEQGVVTLSWPRVEGADAYEIRVGGGKPELTEKLSLAFDDLPKGRAHTFTVRSWARDGGWSLPRDVVGHTFGPGAVMGRVTVRAQADGVDLKTGKTVKAGDLSLVRASGNANYLVFGTPNGSCANGGRAFGDFDGLRRGTAESFGSDDRKDDYEQFFVWTKDGGSACVRIVVRDWPDTVVEYVWLPPDYGKR